MKTNHFLASANSCIGFKNNFEFINPGENAFTYIIKGGPGTGKSTLMKKIGKHFEEKGQTVEYFYCSSDIESLDGVRIVEKQVSIVDGTAPHVTEASIPGVKEKIINVGRLISDDIKQEKSKIKKLLSKKSSYFSLAYAYLKSAGTIFETEKMFQKANKQVIEKQVLEILSLGFKKQKTKATTRKLFVNFVDDKGIDSILHKNSFEKNISLTGNYFENSETLKVLASKFEEMGLSAILFCSIFDPNMFEGLYVKDSNILISNLNLKEYDPKGFKNGNLIKSLLVKAGKSIMSAKTYHKQVEDFYIKNMDFEGLTKITNCLINKIEKF